MFHAQFVGMFMTLLQINHIPSACYLLTLILLTWRIWGAPITASKWQMGFNLAFKGLIMVINRTVPSTILCPRSNLASRDMLIRVQSSVCF